MLERVRMTWVCALVGEGGVEAESNMLKNRFSSFAHSRSPDSGPLPLLLFWLEIVFRPFLLL